MRRKTAIIIGAGPAGLTAAYEFLRRTSVIPVVFEASESVGGLSKTVKHNGIAVDIGPHRFFSKSDRVMNWWFNIMPVQNLRGQYRGSLDITYRNAVKAVNIPEDGPDPDTTENVLLVLKRLTRILYRRHFYDYPLSLNLRTMRNLGFANLGRIALSFMKARLHPVKPEQSLEDFFINRFGRQLYRTFFKDYTEKVWGLKCTEMKPDWGAQRVKGLSISKAVMDALRRKFRGKNTRDGKNTETSLIQFFLYPKLGAGHMWHSVAKRVTGLGGTIHLKHAVVGLLADGNKVTGVRVKNMLTGEISTQEADYVISSMPVRDLIQSMVGTIPQEVKNTAADLRYRELVLVGVMMRRRPASPAVIPDNWIYVQEPDVRVGRIQIMNNWGPYVLRGDDYVCLGMEYFCTEGDAMWTSPDAAIVAMAARELGTLGLTGLGEIVDHVVLRVPKAYPVYFGGYESFHLIRRFVDRYENLFLIGRNGMHKYNNMDHSMLTAMTVVDNIIGGVRSRDSIWSVNTEAEYHEVKKGEQDRNTGHSGNA